MCVCVFFVCLCEFSYNFFRLKSENLRKIVTEKTFRLAFAIKEHMFALSFKVYLSVLPAFLTFLFLRVKKWKNFTRPFDLKK